MPALRELQRHFVAALFSHDDVDDDGGLADSIVANGIDAQARLGIYRNNLREGFRKALALEFPVIEKLVGEQYFRQLSHEFLALHPSRSGDLHHVGGPFAKFLAARFRDTEFAYLADMARLEWAIEESAIAPDAAAFDVAALRDIGADDYVRLKFNLHPACRLVRSAYPILRIWRANQTLQGTDEVIDLGSGGENVLVRRVRGGLELDALTAAQFSMLEGFAVGFDLGAAFQAARIHDDSFDLGAALRRCLSLGVLAHAHLPELACS